MKIRGFLAVLLLAMVVAYFIFFAKTGGESGIETEIHQFARTKIRLTEANFETLAREILSYTTMRDGLPADLDSFKRSRPGWTGMFDAWGKEIRYERLTDSDFRLRSAGPDSIFDTEDDIVKDY